MQIAFYYLLLQLSFILLFNRNKSLCLCGMAGVSLKPDLSAAALALVTMKLKILGIYNESRGKDGCGWYLNGEIHKGWFESTTHNTKLFSDFIEKENLPMIDQKFGNSSMLHCRQSSVGAVVKKNNHPFDIKGKKHNLIFQHNGTVHNIKQLCKTYNIDEKEHSVDSEALGTIIANGNIKVLNNYEGAAALMWIDQDNLDTLYVYHGLSKKVQNGQEYEERPLYFLITEEGIYFSSLESSLQAIALPNEKVNNLTYNVVFQLKNGVFSKNKFIKVERCLNPDPVYTGFSNTGYYNNGNNYSNYNNSLNPLKETKPPCFDSKTRVYFWRHRYWNPNSEELLNGVYSLNKKGEIIKGITVTTEHTYCFFHGMMAKNEESYKKLTTEFEIKYSSKSTGWLWDVSKHVSHPIVMLENERSTSSVNVYVYYDGSCSFNRELERKFSSGRRYEYKNGNLIKIVPSSKNDDPWKTSSCITSKLKQIEQGQIADNIFTKYIWSSFENFYEKATEIELCALYEYCEEYLKSTSPLFIEIEEVKKYAHDAVKKAVTDSLTIAEVLDDDGGWILNTNIQYPELEKDREKWKESKALILLPPAKVNDNVNNFTVIYKSLSELINTLSFYDLYTIAEIESEENQRAIVPKTKTQLFDYIVENFRTIIESKQTISEFYQISESTFLYEASYDYETGSMIVDDILWQSVKNYFFDLINMLSSPYDIMEKDDDNFVYETKEETDETIEQVKDELLNVIDSLEQLTDTADVLNQLPNDIGNTFALTIYQQTSILSNRIINEIDGLTKDDNQHFTTEREKLNQLYNKQNIIV